MTKPVTLTCPDCEGLGEWDEGPLPATSPVQESPDYDRVICERCKGQGQLEKPDACDDCGECVEDGETFDHVVEAMETFEKILCDNCFDNRCENAWVDQQQDLLDNPPVTLDEQHRAAWEQKQGLRR